MPYQICSLNWKPKNKKQKNKKRESHLNSLKGNFYTIFTRQSNNNFSSDSLVCIFDFNKSCMHVHNILRRSLDSWLILWKALLFKLCWRVKILYAGPGCISHTLPCSFQVINDRPMGHLCENDETLFVWPTKENFESFLFQYHLCMVL